MIDLVQLRREPDAVADALARRGVDRAEVAALAELDAEHRRALQRAEEVRARVKAISREVAEASRAGDSARAEALKEESRALGGAESEARAAADDLGERLRERLLVMPNLPSPEAPDGLDEAANVEVRRWWPGADEGGPEPTYADYQRVPHWETGAALGILDLESGAKIAGSMFPLLRGDGARLMRALGWLSLARNSDAYEEIRPPTFALTETMMSTGHLPKSVDDMYGIERDGLWAIPTAEVPLTSMHRGEILDPARLPIRLTAYTACFRREAGAAGRDTRGLLRVHEFDKCELFAYCHPDDHQAAFDDVLARAEAMLRELGLAYRLLDLCCGDLGTSSARTIDLEVYSPGVDQWLEVSSVSWFADYQARRANVRYRTADGGTALVHTVNGSVLGFARVWAALVETHRRADGTVELPAALTPFMGGRMILGA
ncbi:MAG TPA: serine--tRNA ligase [Acidimicrobiales bacterium]|nr:serine--tRNA ligase [Acidimicrobiales bacterium]